MVDLLPLKDEADLQYVHSLLVEFQEKTGSIIAAELMENWPASTAQFVKVCTRNQTQFCRIASHVLILIALAYNLLRFSRTSSSVL